MQRELTEREKWLIERIGKVVYRPDNKCGCVICGIRYNKGVLVRDRSHAIFLSETEIEYTSEGIPMRYFDTRQEAIDFENENKQ